MIVALSGGTPLQTRRVLAKSWADVEVTEIGDGDWDICSA
jgi:hypothetical protein